MQEKTKPTSAQVGILMSDWLGNLREQGTFVRKDTRGAIRRNMRSGEAVSDYILHGAAGDNDADILRHAREMAQNVVNSMTEQSVKVHLGLTDSYTDGTQICVATDYFDDTKLSLGDKVDILMGYAIHEACHINHSDFEALSEADVKEPQTARLKKHVMNILEDERIELLLGDAQEDGGDGMPGFTDYIACCKRHTFANYEKDKKEAGMKEVKERIPRFLNMLTKAVRFPASLTEEEVVEEYDALDAVRRAITPYPRSTKGMLQAADAIMDIIKGMIKEEMQQQQQQQSRDQQQKSQSNDGAQSPSGDGQQDGSSQDTSSGDEQNSQNEVGGESHDTPPEPSTQDVKKALEKALDTNEAKKLMTQLEKADNAPQSDGTKTADCIRYNSNERYYVNGDAERCDAGGGINSIRYAIKAHPDKNMYDKSLRQVKRWIPAMTKALRCKTEERDYCLYGMPSGKLNTNKLVSLKTGNTDVFIRNGSVTADAACVCLLIDESGSMSGTRQQAARDVAVLINEAVKGIHNLEFFAYGFTDETLTIYGERRRANRYALGGTRALGGTPTGAAMEAAAARIRKMTSSKCLMLVVTDGYPNDDVAVEMQDALLPRKGFIPVGVDIAGSEGVKNLFKEAVSITDMSRLAPELSKIVRNRLMKTIKRYDS